MDNWFDYFWIGDQSESLDYQSESLDDQSESLDDQSEWAIDLNRWMGDQSESLINIFIQLFDFSLYFSCYHNK